MRVDFTDTRPEQVSWSLLAWVVVFGKESY